MKTCCELKKVSHIRLKVAQIRKSY